MVFHYVGYKIVGCFQRKSLKACIFFTIYLEINIFFFYELRFLNNFYMTRKRARVLKDGILYERNENYGTGRRLAMCNTFCFMFYTICPFGLYADNSNCYVYYTKYNARRCYRYARQVSE